MKSSRISADEFESLFGSAKQVSVQDEVGSYRSLLAAWLLDLTLMFEWYKPSPNRLRRGLYPQLLDDEDFCKLTGMEPPDDIDDDEEENPRSVSYWKAQFKRHSIKIRRTPVDTRLPLFRNISMLSEILKLTPADKVLLAFSIALSAFPLFRRSIGPQSLETTNQLLHRILAHISGLKESDFCIATNSSSALIASGLIKINSGVFDLESKVDLLKGFGASMLMPHKSPAELMGRFLKKVTAPTLALSNFPHLESDTRLLLPFIQNAIESGAPGTNILLYGKPGVGKSEYVQVLAAALDVDLYEIAFADNDGDPLKGTERLKAFAFCQNLLSVSRRSMLVFDEIEDVFTFSNAIARLFGEDDATDSVGKAWMNRTMERNQVPALWISNRIDQIDPAFLRRFDYSVKFPTPPASVRLSIAKHHLSSFDPSDEWLERIAADDSIVPAQLERAAKVVSLIGTCSASDNMKAIDQILEKSSRLLNGRHLPKRIPSRTGFSLDFLNIDQDASALIAGLKRRPHGGFCFYGPPGTGKSELARHIAEEIGKPLIIRRASDILDKYVGESEKNIAEMFSEARQQSAVLILDEADSFFADRRDVHNQWEVTQINELLTQVEAFEEIFICTTNLMEKFDRAALRRFAFKVRFDYLDRQQRWSLFLQVLERCGGSSDGAGDCRADLGKLDRLTPGDFAVAIRQFELWGTAPTPEGLIRQLTGEQAAKGGSSSRIGF